MSLLQLKAITRTFGSGASTKVVLQNFSHEVEKGEVVAIVGPSGCGKSTLLRTIAFERPEAGIIMLNGQSQIDLDPYHRQVAMLYQGAAEAMGEKTVMQMINYALYKRYDLQHPTTLVRLWMRRLQRVCGMGGQTVATAMSHVRLIGLVRLQAHHLLQRLDQLSGGERQRAMLARVLAEQPQLLLADEPLANLDRALKLDLALEMKQFFKQHNMTVLYVTHDNDEAAIVADRIIDHTMFIV